MTDTATRESGPVDAPASVESIVAELEAGGGESPADTIKEVTQELVNEAEGQPGESDEEPGTEDDATEPAADEPDAEEGNPEGTTEEDAFGKLIASNPDLKVKVKVNGETIEVPLSELPNGYSRTEDYKAKTAAVAEAKREVEALRESTEARVKAEYANQLEEATNLFAQFDPVLAEAQRINWEALKQQDPAAYVQAQDAVNERLNAIRQMRGHVEHIRAETQQRQQQAIERERAERFDKAAEEVVSERPELRDEAKFKAYASDAVATLKDLGFTGEEIVDALDARMLRAAELVKEGLAARAAKKALSERKVVNKSAVKPLTSDGSGSHAPKPRFPSKADRQTKGNWIAEQILSEE